MFFKIHVYEIIIDLTGTSSHHTRHGDEKSGSTVLFLLHFIGLDYQLVTFQIATVVTGHESALKLEKVNFSEGVTKSHSKSLKVTERGYS